VFIKDSYRFSLPKKPRDLQGVLGGVRLTISKRSEVDCTIRLVVRYQHSPPIWEQTQASAEVVFRGNDRHSIEHFAIEMRLLRQPR